MEITYIPGRPVPWPLPVTGGYSADNDYSTGRIVPKFERLCLMPCSPTVWVSIQYRVVTAVAVYIEFRGHSSVLVFNVTRLLDVDRRPADDGVLVSVSVMLAKELVCYWATEE